MVDAISTECAEHYVWGGTADGWHLVEDPSLSVIQERMPPGAAEVMHFHRRTRQFFYVLSGTATMEIDGRQGELGARQGLEVAPETPHQMRNDSPADVEFLVVSTLSSHGDRVSV